MTGTDAGRILSSVLHAQAQVGRRTTMKSCRFFESMAAIGGGIFLLSRTADIGPKQPLMIGYVLSLVAMFTTTKFLFSKTTPYRNRFT